MCTFQEEGYASKWREEGGSKDPEPTLACSEWVRLLDTCLPSMASGNDPDFFPATVERKASSSSPRLLLSAGQAALWPPPCWPPRR
jgi:hypothetical protein